MADKPKSEEKPKSEDKGRFVGVVGVGHERYQVHLIETVGEKVVRREVLSAGRTEMVKGKMVTGNSLAVTRADLNTAVARKLLDVTDLWRK